MQRYTFLIVLLLSSLSFAQGIGGKGGVGGKAGFGGGVSGGGGAKAIIQSGKITCASGGCVATSAAVDTTGANTFVICGSSESALPTLPGDSVGNTYTFQTGQTLTSNNIRCAVACNSTSSATHTFHMTGAFLALTFYAISNGSASCVDGTGSGTTGTTVTTLQPGSVAPAGAGEMFIAAIGSDNNNTSFSIDSSFTNDQTVNNNGSATEQIASAYFLNVGSGAQNPTWTMVPGANYVVTMLAIK